MARRNDELIWGVTGQTLSTRFKLGRPTSAMFSAFRSYMNDDAVAEFSGTATQDSVNTTLSASAGPSQSDPQNIPLTSTTGIVTGVKYLLSLNSVQQWIEPVEVGSNYVRNRYPLQADYTSAATFQGAQLTAAVPDSWAADRSKISDLSDTYQDFRMKWTVVYGGSTYVVYTYFDLVRQPSNHHVEMDDINARVPGLEDSLPTEYRVEDGRPLIDAAWTHVRAHLLAINIDPAALRNNEAMDEAVILAALMILAEGGWAPPGIDKAFFIQIKREDYNRFFETHYQAALKDRLDYQFGPLSRNLVIPQPGIWRK